MHSPRGNWLLLCSIYSYTLSVQGDLPYARRTVDNTAQWIALENSRTAASPCLFTLYSYFDGQYSYELCEVTSCSIWLFWIIMISNVNYTEGIVMWIIQRVSSTILFAGDDIQSLQHLLETIWEYQAQMNESGISDPGDFVNRCRLQKAQALEERSSVRPTGPASS